MTTQWPTQKLGDLCDLVGGGTPAKDRKDFYGGSIPWATVRDMNVDLLTSTEHSLTEAGLESSSSHVIPAGSVVIATRVGLGKVVILAQDTAINQDLRGLVIRDHGKVTNQFLYWWYRSVADTVISAGTGATVQGVTLPFVSSLEVPVPPLVEQQRIVAKLDEVQPLVEKLESHYRRAKNISDELFRSTRSRLLNRSVAIRRTTLGEICSVDWGNTDLTKKSYQVDGAYLAVSATGPDGRIGHAEHSAYVPVLSAIGARCGRMFLPEEPFTAIKNTITLTPKSDLTSGKFLFHLLEHVQLPVRGAAQPFIAKGDIENFPVDIPDQETQQEIVNLLESARLQSARLQSCYESKVTALTALRQSVLAAAFRGDL